MRKLSGIDQFLKQSDHVLRAMSGNTQHPKRPSPALSVDKNTSPPNLNAQQRRHVAGLMRINHTGEVCAQALYKAQSVFAKTSKVKQSMDKAAAEEIDHLVWCEQRIKELDNRVSYLNPIWYGLSFSLGAAAGLMGDKWSLGFVKETEDQVCRHLQEHLEQIPEDDELTRSILKQMHKDEAEHAQMAIEEGAKELPKPVKRTMALVAKAMTRSTYYC